MTAKEKIQKIRKLMIKNKIDFYIISSSDFHQSEDVGEYFRCREFVSGFTGSAGTLLITRDKSYLWTDGWSFIQAEKELSQSEIHLFKSGMKDEPALSEFLKNNLEKDNVLGFDGRVVSCREFFAYEKICSEKGCSIESRLPALSEFLKNNLEKDNVLGFDGRVVSCREFFAYEKICSEKGCSIESRFDFAGEIWENRLPLSDKKLFLLDIKYCGESFESKIKRLREKMKEFKADIHIITSLDDIAWLFNIRGRDIPCNPVVLSYAVITFDEAVLYVNKNKITDEIHKYFSENNIKTKDYFSFYEDLKKIESSKNVLLDYERINSAVYNNIPYEAVKINKTNPTQDFKAVKNETEIKNIINAHIKDGTAFTKFMYWSCKNK